MASSQAVDEFLRKLTTQTQVDKNDKNEYNHFEDSILGSNSSNSEIQRLKTELSELQHKFEQHLLECTQSSTPKSYVMKRERNAIQEGLISDKITKFLRSWSSVYRCTFFLKSQCRHSEDSCLRIHDNNTSFSVIAREIRTILLGGTSPFFTNLLDQSATWKCNSLTQQLAAELQVLIMEFKEQMKEAVNQEN
jgi:hypothetical protein